MAGYEQLGAPLRRPFIVMNPRSGNGKVRRFGLRQKAEQLGATVFLLDDGEPDLGVLLRAAVDDGADLLGVAGGDGTAGLVAGVAADCNVPLLLIPAGTRNHFALDLGLDPAHPDRALDALADGVERSIDLGIAGTRPFVNTVSVGAYAEIVERPDYRENKVLVALAVLPDVLSGREQRHFTVRAGDLVVADPIAALISNNPYRMANTPGGGHRPRLDTGTLGLICVERLPHGDPGTQLRERRLHAPAIVTTAQEVVMDAAHPIPVAIDGESTILDTPMRCGLRPRALRVRLPRERPAADG